MHCPRRYSQVSSVTSEWQITITYTFFLIYFIILICFVFVFTGKSLRVRPSPPGKNPFSRFCPPPRCPAGLPPAPLFKNYKDEDEINSTLFYGSFTWTGVLFEAPSSASSLRYFGLKNTININATTTVIATMKYAEFVMSLLPDLHNDFFDCSSVKEVPSD